MLLMVVLLAHSFASSGNNAHYRVNRQQVSNRIDRETPQRNRNFTVTQKSVPHYPSPYDLQWVKVDSMQNAFGTSSPDINPFVYDPWCGALAIIHKGALSYSSGSGTLWYNVSYDSGLTWSRISHLEDNASYTSCAISNATQSTHCSYNIFLFAFPAFVVPFFGTLVYGLEPLGSGTPFTTLYQGEDYSSPVCIWAADSGNNVYSLVERTGTTPHTLCFWRTTNQGESWSEIKCWGPENWVTLYSERGQTVENTIYVECVVQDSTVPDGHIVFKETKSTDNGTTWSAWEVIDWKNIPALSNYDDWGTLDGNLSNDFVVDANGYEHYFASLVDTNATIGGFDVVEIYRTANGWSANVIAPRTTSFSPGIGALQQMDNELHATISEDRHTIAVSWVDAPNSSTGQGDIFACGRYIDKNWSDVYNLTQTSGCDGREMSTHLATRMRTPSTDSLTTIYLSKTEGLDESVCDDSMDETAPCVIWAASATFSIRPRVTSVNERESKIPTSLVLEQNYPNPFNPLTSFGFQILTSSFVSLKIFNILGNEIATLVNEKKSVGNYSVQWNAETFPSGMYFYQLKAGEFSEAKKMILAK